jgi:hypothetical protein
MAAVMYMGRPRTGCLLMIETRLNALMVTATQITAEIWSEAVRAVAGEAGLDRTVVEHRRSAEVPRADVLAVREVPCPPRSPPRPAGSPGGTRHGEAAPWLRSGDLTRLNGTERTFVFVPVLMVAGAALSGLALVIQKVAGATARPGAERRLAGRLAALTAPPGAGPTPLEDRPAVASRR